MRIIEVYSQEELDRLTLLDTDDISMNIIKVNFDNIVISKSYPNAVIHVCKNATLTDCSIYGNYIITHGGSIINICCNNINYHSVITATQSSTVVYIYIDDQEITSETAVHNIVTLDSMYDNITKVVKKSSIPWNDISWEKLIKAVVGHSI